MDLIIPGKEIAQIKGSKNILILSTHHIYVITVINVVLDIFLLISKHLSK